MSRDSLERDHLGKLVDQYGREQLIVVAKHAAPGLADSVRGYEPCDTDGRRQIVLLDASGGSLAGTGKTATTPDSPHYFGNATPSEYTAEPNIPIQVKTYHGNAGGYAVTGRPQGI